MALPPTDIPPSELWLKLSERKPSEVIDFPRKGRDGKPLGFVRIQVLSMEDHNRARLSAQNELRKSAGLVGLPKLESQDMASPAVQEVLGDLTAHELLTMACLSDTFAPGSTEEDPFYPRVFRDAEDLRKKLSAYETVVLFNAYLLVQDKYGPFERGITSEEDVNAWIQRLEEGANAFPLLHLASPRLVELTCSLAARVSTLSRILVSQWESLPASLKSSLEPFSLATSFCGEQPSEETLTSSENLADVEVTTLQAARLAAEQVNDRIR